MDLSPDTILYVVDRLTAANRRPASVGEIASGLDLLNRVAEVAPFIDELVAAGRLRTFGDGYVLVRMP